MKRLLLLGLTAPVIASAQIFPSPTFSSLTLQNPLTAANGGTGATTSTGTGSAVLSNSPAFITPNLGTPSAVTLTNGTGLPIATGVSGLGTGVAAGLANAATGSGAPVLGTSPTISSPTLNGTYAGSMTIPSTSLTYTASGTGGVSQTLSNRFAQTAYIDSYGAVGNGTSDDSTPLTNAMAALGASGGVVFLDCTKNYAILSNLTIPANVSVIQCRSGNPWGNPGVDWSSEPLASQPHINLASTATITMSSNSGFDGVILKAGTTFPVSSPSGFAGTAIKLATGGAEDVHLNTLIVGFATCVDGTSGGDHQHWDIECDGNPAASVGAVIIGNGGDSNYFKIRTYPWGTVGAASPTLTRTGTGIQILPGPLDDARMDLFDYGHAVGLDTRANGGVHYIHVWMDTNSTANLNIYNNSGSTFDSINAWTSPLGVVLESSSNFSIGTLYCNGNGVASANCIANAASTSPNVQIGLLHVASESQYAVNLATTGARLSIGSAILTGVNGGAAPYIVGPSGWTSDQVQIGKIVSTDLVTGGSLFGGNVQALPSIASASLLAPLPGYNHLLVTGSTTITNISGAWNDRILILTFAGALTLTNNANIQLTAAANLTTGAGTTIALWYDQTGCACWREMWHH
ncbi:hypothetical protein L2Y90_12975 [Burkholderia pyrrocinia]|uniref:hypothetical protein n=1 Tax=Burkholderia pyrrocinia TaxID=60550 RepID=UPI00215A821D|nr:hypothetical protein [Burkholderia pyrrocinia]UVE64761.1 hypothetical protein L2Y90_12975 [Burkholderia pyrrocinia]